MSISDNFQLHYCRKNVARAVLGVHQPVGDTEYTLMPHHAIVLGQMHVQ
ncbi:hypothetical protein DICVIV_02994 [Dictyocaulus viviparus]|uniref:Uncharacterized protein n=1 Tax=Dictyocaulus viviparus TaxID=29172 RepID=A0A0D8Y4B8_DICVI|nr:hypothetical protein DICVIV_02994 [Dictyocaulus viviparus]